LSYFELSYFTIAKKGHLSYVLIELFNTLGKKNPHRGIQRNLGKKNPYHRRTKVKQTLRIIKIENKQNFEFKRDLEFSSQVFYFN
jgi:hypothetical protein